MSMLEMELSELKPVLELGLQSGTGVGLSVVDFGPDEIGEEPGLEQELVSLGYTPEQVERVIDYYGAKIQEAIDENQWIEVRDLDAFGEELIRGIQARYYQRHQKEMV